MGRPCYGLRHTFPLLSITPFQGLKMNGASLRSGRCPDPSLSHPFGVNGKNFCTSSRCEFQFEPERVGYSRVGTTYLDPSGGSPNPTSNKQQQALKGRDPHFRPLCWVKTHHSFVLCYPRPVPTGWLRQWPGQVISGNTFLSQGDFWRAYGDQPQV